MLPLSDRSGSNRLQFPADRRPLATLFTCLILAGCGEEPPEESPPAAPEAAPEPAAGASFLPDASAGAQDCGEAGFLQVDLFGALAGEDRWTTETLRCEGMPRPDGAGARLRFAGPFGAEAQPVAFIIAVPALTQGEVGAELPSNLTLIAEGQGRFFSTPDLEGCWTDISAQTPLGPEGLYRIDGQIYCISPIPEVNGAGSVSIDEFSFSGLVDWTAS